MSGKLVAIAAQAVLFLGIPAITHARQSSVIGPPSDAVAARSLEPEIENGCGEWTIDHREVPDAFSVRDAAPYHFGNLYGRVYGWSQNATGRASDSEWFHTTRLDRGSSGVWTLTGEFTSGDDVLCHGVVKSQLYSYLRAEVRPRGADCSALVRAESLIRFTSSCDGQPNLEMLSSGKRAVEAKGALGDAIRISFGWGGSHISVEIPEVSNTEIVDVGISHLGINAIAADNFTLSFHMAQNNHIRADGGPVFTALATSALQGVSWATRFELEDVPEHCP